MNSNGKKTWRDEGKPVGGFEEFVSYVKDILPSEASDAQLYWFRGQRNASWDLETSLLRSLRHSSIWRDENHDQASQLELDALRAFQNKAHLFINPSFLAKIYTHPCWWAVMQHYGAPTRLLDWTISPYVAAYFACLQDGEEMDGAVWAFCEKTLVTRFVENNGPPPLEFDDPRAKPWYENKIKELRGQSVVMPLEFRYVTSERIMAQQGRFTMGFNVLQGHNCVVDQVGSKFARKIVIAHEKKPEFLLRLRDMNITGATLFPGIEGLGRAAGEIISLGAHFSTAICAQEQVISLREPAISETPPPASPMRPA